MIFTDGKKRYYERLMQLIPNFQKRTSGEYRPRFRYRFRDLDCQYCDLYKRCEHRICPHIMENLNDLIADKEFLTAVDNAESCKTAQRGTLMFLHKELPAVFATGSSFAGIR